jgi:hypothetical protein
MSELFKPFGRFISRDVPYIVGGGSILMSLVIVLNLKAPLDVNVGVQLFVAGIAYVVGYTVQEVLSLTPLVNTSICIKPSPLMQSIYERWTRQEWVMRSDLDYQSLYDQLYATLSAEKLAAFDRVVMLKHIGTAVGSSWLFVGTCLLIGASFQNSMPLLILGLLAMFFSLALLLTGWLQAMQMINMVPAILNQLPASSPDKA